MPTTTAPRGAREETNVSTIQRGTIPHTRYTDADYYGVDFIQIVTASNSLYTMTENGYLYKGDNEFVMYVDEAWIPRNRRERALFIGTSAGGSEWRVSTSPVVWYHVAHAVVVGGSRARWIDTRDQFTLSLISGEVPHVGH